MEVANSRDIFLIYIFGKRIMKLELFQLDFVAQSIEVVGITVTGKYDSSCYIPSISLRPIRLQ